MVDIKKIIYGFLNIGIYIFLTLFIMQILNIFNIKNIIILNFYYLLAPIIVAIVLVIINKDLFPKKINDFKKNKKKYLAIICKYYICGFIIMNILTLIIGLYSPGLPENEEQNRELLKLLPIYSSISMVITGPLSEEIVFRGSFNKSFKNKQLYLFFTSIIFGLAHVISSLDFINFLPYAALGYFFGKIYYETDNILTSAIAHSVHNLLCILIIFMGGLF